MLVLPANWTMACLSALAILTGIMAFSRYQRGHTLSRSRLGRATRPNKSEGKTATDLPSIARERYAFLRKRYNSKGHFLSVLMAVDDLLFSSGVRCSPPFFLSTIIFISITLAFIIYKLIGINFFGALAIALSSSTYLSLQLLVRLKARKLHRFQEIFPEALDLIVRSVRAGLPVSESMKMIGTEVADPVGEAFREVASNLVIGMSLDEALTLLQRKFPIQEVKFFSISLTIQQETGGNLAEILFNLAAIMRKRVQIGKKIRALSSEARASALIIGSLPFIVGIAIYALNRDYIEVLLYDELGRFFLFGALGSIAGGAIVMAKLIRFEI